MLPLSLRTPRAPRRRRGGRCCALTRGLAPVAIAVDGHPDSGGGPAAVQRHWYVGLGGASEHDARERTLDKHTSDLCRLVRVDNDNAADDAGTTAAATACGHVARRGGGLVAVPSRGGACDPTLAQHGALRWLPRISPRDGVARAASDRPQRTDRVAAAAAAAAEGGRRCRGGTRAARLQVSTAHWPRRSM